MKITYKLLGNCPIEETPLDSIMKIVDDGEKTKNMLFLVILQILIMKIIYATLRNMECLSFHVMIVEMEL